MSMPESAKGFSLDSELTLGSGGINTISTVLLEAAIILRRTFSCSCCCFLTEGTGLVTLSLCTGKDLSAINCVVVLFGGAFGFVLAAEAMAEAGLLIGRFVATADLGNR
jgi:hypothetical protein